jgi:LPS-assembly lipoprotein
MKKIIALMLCASLLSACGWHLRGSLSLPDNVKNIYISDSSKNGVTASTLTAILKQSNVGISDSQESAQYSIHLSNEREDRRTISVGSDSLASEYELTHEVDYYIADNMATILSPVTTARVIRSYNYDRDDVIAKNEEEDIIRKEMRSNLANQILNRLRFLAPKPAQADLVQSAPAQVDSAVTTESTDSAAQ